MKPVTEESGEHKAWYEEARKVRCPEELAAFVRRVVDGYEHDYGTVCHAVAASALAAATCANRMDGSRGGITGFQAGAVMWQFVQEWLHLQGKPLRLVQFEDMLYPQYEERFEKTISAEAFLHLQNEAKSLLKKDGGFAHRDVTRHWQSIADGKPPFGYRVEVER